MHEFLVFADDVILLGENLSTLKKNTTVLCSRPTFFLFLSSNRASKLYQEWWEIWSSTYKNTFLSKSNKAAYED
jgi:hypothetical protein